MILKDMENNIHIIIKNFKINGFDDNNISKKYLSNLLENYEENINDDILIKQMIKDELIILKNHININKENEFILLPETFDHKMGHWYSLLWITSRWFKNCKSINELPEWYIKIVDILNIKEENRTCENVVSQLLESL